MERIESAAKTVLAAASDGDMLRTHVAILRRLSKSDPFDRVGLRRLIAHRVIEAGKYVVT
jgi:hypothetical protein